MKKPTLLYVSPFWPKKSGISEYSEALIMGLDLFFNITLVVENYSIESKIIKSKFNIVKYSPNKDFSGYDYIIYNFGNNPDYHLYMYEMIQKYPGYIILHDYILYYLSVGYYKEKDMLFQKIYEMEGVEGIRLVKESLKRLESRDLLQHKQIASLLPMNQEVINNSRGVFVHSEYSQNILRKSYNTVTYKINLVKCRTPHFADNRFLYRYFNIKDDVLIIGSVGFIAETKQNAKACLAIKKYNETHREKIHYVMIGEGDYVDHLLDQYIHKTGFLDNDEFFEAINSCNLILNLRYPYHGESSATLIQCMDIRKPCVVTDIGWFSELPDNGVIKLPQEITVDELCNEIERLTKIDLTKIADNAKAYVDRECDSAEIASRIYQSIVYYTKGKKK